MKKTTFLGLPQAQLFGEEGDLDYLTSFLNTDEDGGPTTGIMRSGGTVDLPGAPQKLCCDLNKGVCFMATPHRHVLKLIQSQQSHCSLVLS